MNTLGLVCAVTTFFCIWFGHLAVRFIEARSASIRIPAAAFVLLGLGLESGALLSNSPALSAALGIAGLLSLWDALELFRQERRVIKGHAPANPRNPRHQRILAQHPAASSIHWLKREPLGRPLTAEEIQAIREAAVQ